MNTLTNRTKVLLTSILLMGAAVFSTSCGKGSSRNLEIPGVDGPVVSMFEDNVLISMVFENLYLDGGARFAIPKYPNSYVELSPDFASGGTLMAISISLDDVFDGGVDKLDPQTLPGGRALPGVLGGKLPAVAFSIEKFNNMAFYVGPEVFGVFVPLKKLDLQGGIISTRFYEGKSRLGNLALVGQDANGENAGVLLMLSMKDSIQKRLERINDKY